jgi:2-isopropylmalate synthase
VDGILKEKATYEIIRPETIGLSGSRMVLGRHTGRKGFAARCRELGFELSDQQLERAYRRFVEIADKKKEVFDEDVAAIVSDEVYLTTEPRYQLIYLHVSSGTGTVPTASVRIKTPDGVRQAAACGDGPVDAAYQAIRDATGLEPTLESYSIRAVTGGKEALGEAIVRVRHNGKVFLGRGVSTDIIEASARAYVDALNKMAMAAGQEGQSAKE